LFYKPAVTEYSDGVMIGDHVSAINITQSMETNKICKETAAYGNNW
jgi:hypothetical protein